MSKLAYLFCASALFLILFLRACNRPIPIADVPTVDAPLAVTPVSAMPKIPATGNFIKILAVIPPVTNGPLPSNTMTLTLHYRLEAGPAILTVGFERFKDANCTTPDTDARPNEKSGSTIGGMEQAIGSGSQEIQVVISPPVSPVDASYVSIGASLSSKNGYTALAEDNLYANCYAVSGKRKKD